MSDQIVRCPYCVEDGEFRPMRRRSNQWFYCATCAHRATPTAQHSSCACPKCQEMDQISIRCRRARPDHSPRDIVAATHASRLLA